MIQKAGLASVAALVLVGLQSAPVGGYHALVAASDASAARFG
jgi:hypothetical protein